MEMFNKMDTLREDRLKMAAASQEKLFSPEMHKEMERRMEETLKGLKLRDKGDRDKMDAESSDLGKDEILERHRDISSVYQQQQQDTSGGPKDFTSRARWKGSSSEDGKRMEIDQGREDLPTDSFEGVEPNISVKHGELSSDEEEMLPGDDDDHFAVPSDVENPGGPEMQQFHRFSIRRMKDQENQEKRRKSRKKN